jgi:transcriptional regulator with XRE-family HTH domain
MDLGRRIAMLRVERGLTQRELAKQMRLACSTIGMWETGDKVPSPSNRARLAETLGVPIRDLMPEWIDQPPSSLVITEPELIAFIRSYRSLTPRARAAMLTAVQALAMIQARPTEKIAIPA